MTDTTKVNQYQDQVVEAVGTIVRKAVESISFDKTIVCTIKDDSGRENGEYIVTDGSSTFSAYSYDTSLRNGNSVYVTVPEGNYDNEKLIIGKRKSDTSVSYSYKEPFNRIIDLTGNLAVVGEPVGLICNEKSSGTDYVPQSIKIYEKNLIEEQDNQYTGFNYIGLKADFRTIMNNAAQGEYGLKLIITVKRYLTESEIKSYKDLEEKIKKIKEEIEKPQSTIDFGKNKELKRQLELLEKELATLAETIDIKNKCKYFEYECRLSSNKDMFGNPYMFYMYQEQQAIFPISSEDIIMHYRIELYENGKFTDVNQQLINKQSATTIDGANIEQNQAKQENIFVNNIYLCAGVDAENIYNEYLNLYTFSSPTYYSADEEKVVNLRWMKKNDKGIFEDVIPEEKDEGIQLAELDEESGETSTEEEVETTVENDIRWYRYRLGAPAADQFCGVYWERQSPKDLKQLVFNPSLNYQEEKIKVIIVEITKDKNGNIIDEKVVSRSDILVFENEIHSDMYNSVEGLEGIYLSFDDGSNGDYYLYSQGNQLIDKSQGQKVRTATLWEKLNEKASEVNLEDCSTITWKLPLKNTMLSFSNIPEKFKDSEFMELEKTTSINYKIKTQYNPNATNNTITCIIRKNENTYLVNKKIDFGRMGTNGSDYTLVIETEHNAILMNKADTYTYQARVYGATGQEVPNATGFAWSWYSSGSGLSLEEHNDSVKVKANGSVSGLYILQVTWSGLTTYLPIALTASKDYQYSGPTEIIYPTTGELEYCNLECKIENKNFKPKICVAQNGDITIPDDEISDAQNEIKEQEKIINDSTKSEKEKEDAKKEIGKQQAYINEHKTILNTIGIINSNYFKPISFYIKDNIQYGIVLQSNNNNQWIQPILVLQNKYPSTIVNQWDGVTVTVDVEEGYILSPVLAAGKKDGANTFSGVMIGDMGNLLTGNELSRNTGIYGFHQGAVSYAFKDDGTAYIGKSGGGRLHFDGSQSTITSASYRNGGKGIKIDLDNPYIHIRDDVSKPIDNIPFQVNDVTKIDWDGTLTSNKVNLIGGRIGKDQLYMVIDNNQFSFNHDKFENDRFVLTYNTHTDEYNNTYAEPGLYFEKKTVSGWESFGGISLSPEGNVMKLDFGDGFGIIKCNAQYLTVKGGTILKADENSAIYANFA